MNWGRERRRIREMVVVVVVWGLIEEEEEEEGRWSLVGSGRWMVELLLLVDLELNEFLVVVVVVVVVLSESSTHAQVVDLINMKSMGVAIANRGMLERVQ